VDQNLITRRFIVLARKLRDDVRKSHKTLHNDLVRLADGLKNLKDAISAQWQSNQEQGEINPRITVADFQAQVPIRVQTETKRSKREIAWRYFKGTLEIIGILAAIIYAWVAYHQWQETIEATNFTARQTELSRKGLNEAIKNFRIEQRARIGTPMFNIGPPGRSIGPNTRIVGNVEFENFGKMPGIIDGGGIILEVRNVSSIPVNFRYPSRERSTAIVYPGQKGMRSNDYAYTVPAADFPAIKLAEKKRLVLHGFVRYHDDFGSYRTEYCFYWVGDDTLFSPCADHNTTE
jgi:hypothetical protein